MIKAVVFDAFGTILHNIPPSFPRTLLRYFNSQEIKALEAKAQISETSLIEFILNFSNSKISSEELDRILRADLAKIKYHEDFLPVLDELKVLGYKTGLISNIAPDYRDAIIEKLNIEELIDVCVYSCSEGCVKPDEKIFKIAAQKLQTAPEEIVMVGNSLLDDFKAAINANYKAILMDREGTIGIHHSIKTLNQLPQKLKSLR